MEYKLLAFNSPRKQIFAFSMFIENGIFPNL